MICLTINKKQNREFELLARAIVLSPVYLISESHIYKIMAI